MGDYAKGEVTGRVRGRQKTLCLDMAALDRFEKATGKKAFAALEAMSGDDAGYVLLRELVRSAMLKHHPDATIAEAAAFIRKRSDKLRELLQAALPDADDVVEEGETQGKQGGAKG